MHAMQVATSILRFRGRGFPSSLSTLLLVYYLTVSMVTVVPNEKVNEMRTSLSNPLSRHPVTQARILVTKEADFLVHSIPRSHGANFDQMILLA
jgi:hypothetical protein